jgi:hypothetical protein
LKAISGIHIQPLANQLVKKGIKITVYVPDNHESALDYLGKIGFEVRSFDDVREFDRNDKIVFHAWTPREVVRKKTERLAEEYNADYFVHLEDDEERIVSTIISQEFTR